MLSRIYSIQSDDRTLNQFQDQVIRKLSPVFQNPLLDGVLLQSVSLSTGDNVVNHSLNRPLIGWFLTRRRGSATVYDKQDSNSTPSLTLILNASGSVVVDMWVF